MWTSGSSGIGYGQTWQNVTSSRAASVVYTNATGKPILVSVWLHGSGSDSYCTIDLFVDGLQIQRGRSGGGGYSQSPNVTGIVPHGSSYYVVRSNCHISGWRELR